MLHFTVYNVNMTSESELNDKIDELENELVLLRFGMLHILAHINDTLGNIDKWQRWQVSNSEIDNLIQFRDEIVSSFDDGEFRDLCMGLEVDYDILGGEGLGDKARELILFYKRRGELKQLREHVRLVRPNGFWIDTA